MKNNNLLNNNNNNKINNKILAIVFQQVLQELVEMQRKIVLKSLKNNKVIIQQ